MKAHEAAYAAFDKYAGMNTPALPANAISRVQVLIHRYYPTRDMSAQLLRAVRMLGEIGQKLTFRPNRSSSELRPDITPLIADVLAGLMQLCTLLRLDLGTIIEQMGKDLVKLHNVFIPSTHCVTCTTKLLEPQATGAGENCIQCTACNRWFCDSCYDTSKGDGCYCHPIVTP